jgi:hypothetical protein
LAMPTDPYIEGTEDSEHPVERQGFAREWKQFLVAFLIQADELLAREGVITDSASSMKLAELLVTRLQDALDVHHRSRRGDFRPDPLPSTFPAWEGRHPEATAKTSASEPAVPLSSLYHGWKLVAVVKPRTVSETDYAVRDLTAFMGHDDAAKITRDDLTRWRKAMKDEGRSNNTWNNRLSLVRQVFAHGVSEGVLKVDPTTGLRLRKARQKSPPPYSDADAARILVAARKETRPSLRWAHWVMAFSGMRAGEVLQLLGSDVRQDGAIWLIDVNEAADRLDEDERGWCVIPSPSGDQHTAIVSEPGLYSLISTSRSPNAAPFRGWVNHGEADQLHAACPSPARQAPAQPAQSSNGATPEQQSGTTRREAACARRRPLCRAKASGEGWMAGTNRRTRGLPARCQPVAPCCPLRSA